MEKEGFDYRNEIEKLHEQNAKMIESLKPVFAITQKLTRELSESLLPAQKALEEFRETIKSHVLNPDSFIDNINKACQDNTKFGWCISAHMTISSYRKIASNEHNQEEKDRVFISEFESNNFELYEQEKKSIILSAQEGWRTFYKECFYLIDNQKYQAVIPSLMSAIEHELTSGQTRDYGKKLIERLKTSLKNEGDPTSLLYAVSTSVLTLLDNKIFKSRDFDRSRLPIINRNWVLHGRDTPSLWGKQDVYKLIAIISALRMLNK
ncbi:hypothetical protein MF625_001006 [Paenibacillus polymyxa]|uniref:hypothetical protein n=1 Tax=Paenibacillus polymyxa TaxID=1406 RepID=UPI0020251B46|nr:hypothetical protein [Paenibacillus polymyxa]URJ36588.3 hypothetical protein MF625_001006 [Paenibacillus polymyxa]